MYYLLPNGFPRCVVKTASRIPLLFFAQTTNASFPITTRTAISIMTKIARVKVCADERDRETTHVPSLPAELCQQVRRIDVSSSACFLSEISFADPTLRLAVVFVFFPICTLRSAKFTESLSWRQHLPPPRTWLYTYMTSLR